MACEIIPQKQNKSHTKQKIQEDSVELGFG
jgi:hypothetical protein